MYQQTLIITALEPLIFSDSPVTVEPTTLDYIPGSALLGAVAARLYSHNLRHAQTQDNWRLFHSGEVIFGNAYPCRAQSPALPAPLAWHAPKGADCRLNELKDTLLDREAIHTRACTPEGQPLKGFPHSYITPDGHIAPVHRTRTLKTAIEKKTGIAKESHLFAYQAILPGQRFACVLRAQRREDLELIQQALGNQVRLGRSRSAEFGLAALTWGESIEQLETTALTGPALTLWCLSDLAALDQNGQPTFTPQPRDLGLPEGRLELAQSFIRTRGYSPFNQARQAYDVQRQVILQGSVLQFTLKKPLEARHHQGLLAGLGAYTPEGLGQVWLAQPFWDEAHPRFLDAETAGTETYQFLPRIPAETPQTPASCQGPSHDPDADAFLDWLNQRGSRQTTINQASGPAQALFERLRQFYDSARKLNVTQEVTGPSARQWALVQNQAQGCPDLNTLKQRLFDPKKGLCKQASEREGVLMDWGVEGSYEGKIISFAQWLEEQVKALHQPDPAAQALAIEIMAQLAHRMRRAFSES